MPVGVSFVNIPVLAPDPSAQRSSVGPIAVGPIAQAKLSIGAVDDPLEREADRAADRVVGGAALDSNAAPWDSAVSASMIGLMRKCAKCSNEEGEKEPSTVRHDFAVPRGGQPLSPYVRAFFEPRFGWSFADVRIHHDAAAAQRAQALSARAYTVGSDIVFGDGEYAPRTAEGMRLLAHELAHVVQQREAGAGPPDRIARQSAPTPQQPPTSRPTTARDQMVMPLSPNEERWLRQRLIAGSLGPDVLLRPALEGDRTADTTKLASQILEQRFEVMRTSDAGLQEWYFGREVPADVEALFEKFRKDVVAPAYDAAVKELGDLVKNNRPDASKPPKEQTALTLFAMNLLAETGTFDYVKTGRPALEAVAQVVMNRRKCGFNNLTSTSAIITSPGQFSWLSHPNEVNDAMRPVERTAPIPPLPAKTKKPQDKPETRARLWLEALDVARDALGGMTVSREVKNALSYLNPQAAARQSWSIKANYVTRVGLHCFYQPPTGCATPAERLVDPDSCKSPCHC